MAYTEIKERNKKKYFYRVLSIRQGKKVSKKRKYLGLNLSKQELQKKEIHADRKLFEEKRKRKGNEFEKLKKQIVKILKENKIKKAGIFGSYARGEQKKNSDIDILIQPNKNSSGFGFAGLQINLEKKLNIKIDLLTYNGIHYSLKDSILNEEIKII